MPANAYRICDHQFVETVKEHTITDFANITRSIPHRIRDDPYTIIEDADVMVERFKGYFPQTVDGRLTHRISTLPPKIMLDCVCGHLNEMIQFEREMYYCAYPYDIPNEYIYVFENYHFRLIKHALRVLIEWCRRFENGTLNCGRGGSDTYSFNKTDLFNHYNTFKDIIRTIDIAYSVIAPTTLMNGTDWRDVNTLFNQLEEMEPIRREDEDACEGEPSNSHLDADAIADDDDVVDDDWMDDL